MYLFNNPRPRTFVTSGADFGDLCNLGKQREKLLKTKGVSKFKYDPEIICIGRRKELRYEVYKRNADLNNSVWNHMNDQSLGRNLVLSSKIYKSNMVDLDGDQSYVISAGTCKGDSGGPVFVRSKLAAPAVFLFLLKSFILKVNHIQKDSCC